MEPTQTFDLAAWCATQLSQLAATHPILMSILVAVGGLRLLMKPIMVGLHRFVRMTPTAKDNELLAKLESSKAWRAFAWTVDYLGSVKLPVKTPTKQ